MTLTTDQPDNRGRPTKIRLDPIDSTPEFGVGDCLNVAVALTYGVAYSSTPLPRPPSEPLRTKAERVEHGRQWSARWDQWAASIGHRWWRSDELAPVGLSRWIATVDPLGVSRPHPNELHAVAMSGNVLLADPSWVSVHPRESYRSLNIADDVRNAWALIPATASVHLDPDLCIPLNHPKKGSVSKWR